LRADLREKKGRGDGRLGTLESTRVCTVHAHS
jgi:hypothetical protein